MKAYDMINKQELDLDRKALIDLMLHDRQVDLAFDQVRSDADGYLDVYKRQLQSVVLQPVLLPEIFICSR